MPTQCNESLGNVYVAYRLVKALALPFEKWEAYKLGLIDKDGNIIKKASSSEEKNALNLFDRVVLKLRRTIMKFTGKSKAASILTALFLLKEEAGLNKIEFQHILSEMSKFDKDFKEYIIEKEDSLDNLMLEVLDEAREKV